MNALVSNASMLAGAGLLCVVGAKCARALAAWNKARADRALALRSKYQDFAERVGLAQRARPSAREAMPGWKGYRRFIVQRTELAAVGTTSLYLHPEDGRSLAPFKPGQYLTVRVSVPGLATPQVRCYSLSDDPCAAHYRLTIKNAGKASAFLNAIQPGTALEIQAPRGEFYLVENDTRPLVLIAAGIGITPIYSMLSVLLRQSEPRPIRLFYGVRNGSEHIFQRELLELARRFRNFQYFPCYSQPQSSDQWKVDYVAQQRIDVPLLRKLLPYAGFPFYLCGPGAFMESTVAGLRAWGCAEEDLHFESFGPSSLKRMAAIQEVTPTAGDVRVTFESSDRRTTWKADASTLLELGEQQGVALPSGCRSGSCGMCAVKLKSGSVRYVRKPAAEIPPGHCLACVARPADQDLVLDA